MLNTVNHALSIGPAQSTRRSHAMADFKIPHFTVCGLLLVLLEQQSTSTCVNRVYTPNGEV